MYFEHARRAIETHFGTEWAAGAYSTTAVEYENVPADAAKPFVALFISEGGLASRSLGKENALRVFTGVIVAEIFVKAAIGTQLPRLYGDLISSIFEDAQLSYGNSGTITCKVPEYRGVGVQNGWYKARVSIPFDRDVQYTAAQAL